MPVFLDVKSRLDVSAANLAAREAVRLFDRAGQDASKAFTNPLSKALGSLDMSAMRRQLDLLSGDYAKLAASEEEAARRMVRSMGQVEVAQKRLAEATAKYGADSSKAAAANVALADSHAVAARNTKQHVDAMVASEAAAANLSRATDDAGRSAGRAGQAFNAAGIGSVALFGAALVETTKKAGDFQASQTKLITSAGESAQNLKLVSDGLLEMAGKVGFSAQELSKGMYIVESGGYHGAEGLKVMKAAAQGAAAEQSDLTTVNNALTTSLHDFGFGADMAADVMSKMIAAVGAGKTNIQEFSGALHSVEPAAAAAHIKLEDVYGTLAMITQSGESADQATENMRNAINSLAQPTSQQREAMSQFGVSADDVSQKLGERGLAGSMQYLSEAILKHMDPAGKISVSELNQNAQAAQNATAMLDQMSPAARKSSEAFKDHAMGSREYTMAIRGANDEDSAKMKHFLALENTVNGFSSRFKNGKDIIETYNAALKDVTGTVAGQTVALQVTGEHAQATNDLIHTLTGTTREHDGTVKGFNETQETLNQKMAEAKAAFGAAAIELGTVFVPMMTNVANAAKWVGDEFAKHPGIAQDVTVAVGAMGGAWLAIKAYNIASTILSPIGNGLVGLTRMLGGVELQAGTASVAMRGMGAAAQEGAVGVEAAAAEEVTAEQTVTASALEADAAMSGGGAAGGGGPGKGRFRSGLRGFAGALPIVGPTTMAALEAGKQLNPNNDLSHVADNQDWGHMLLGQSWDWIHGRASGGPIYGHGPKGRDSVPALLAPGEHVLTHHDVAAMGGQRAVYNFRSALHRQYGGDVGGDDGGPVSRLYQEARTLNGGRYVWGSTDCCLIGSTLVYGPNGAKPISELQRGDEVYSYDGGKTAVRLVTAAWQSKTQPVFKVRTRNRAVVASANHPFLRLAKQGVIKTRGRSASAWGIEWARLDELKPGDLLVQPRDLAHRENLEPAVLPDGTKVTADVAWLIGAIIGDGTVMKHSRIRKSRARKGIKTARRPGLAVTRSIRLCLFGEERGRAEQIIRDTWGITALNRSDHHGLQFHRAELVDALLAMGFHRRGSDKRVPQDVWGWEEKLRRAFLDGYCDADGYRIKDPARNEDRSYSSCSERLINEVRAMHVSLGDPVSNVTANRRTKPIVIKGVPVKKALPLHSFTVYMPRGHSSYTSGCGDRYGEMRLRQNRGIRTWLDDNDFSVAPVLKITPEGVQDTFDIEVGINHNFIADGFVVHNSGAVSMLVDAALGTSGRMSTATAAQWLASKGFQSGMGGPGSLSIGWYNGGPGGGHMAATLPDGTHFESGGQHGGIMLGGSAAGAETSEFTSHMHLPLQGFYPDGPAGGMGGMGGAAGAFGGGGFGGGGAIPAGSTAGTGPGGQAGYYTPSPEKVASAQERLRHLDEEIRIAEERKTHMKANASQAEKDRLDEEIRHLKEERGQEEGRLAKAEQGTFHAGRGGGGRGGKAGLPVPLDDHFGLGKGLPGLAEYAVSFLEDLVLGPLETAAMAQFGGGAGGGMPSGGPADLVGAFGGAPGGGGGPSGGGGSGGGGAEGPASRTAGGGGGGGSAPWWTGGQGSNPARSAPTPWWTGGQPHPNAPASPRLDVPPPDMTPPWMSSLDPRGRLPGTPKWWLPSIAPQDFNPNFPSDPSSFGPHKFATGGFISTGDGYFSDPNYGAGQAPVPGGAFRPYAPTQKPSEHNNVPMPWGGDPEGGPWSSWGKSTQNASYGPSGTDTVPAWLSPGEFVVNADATKQFGSSLQWMNAQHYDTGSSGPIDVHGNTPPAPQPAPAAPPQGAMSPKPGAGQPGGKTAGPLPLPGLVGASPLPAMDQGNKPSSDIHNLPGLATPGADSPGMGAGLPASPGIGFSGGVIGAAEGAASSAGDMMAPGSGAAMQIAFQEINRAASFGAQAAGIGVEALLEGLLPSSGAVGGDFAKTIPGRLLMGVTGVRPTGQNTAGNTTGPAAQSEGGGQGGGVGFQLNGDMHVHTPDAHSFGDQMQSETQAAGGTYPFATAGR